MGSPNSSDRSPDIESPRESLENGEPSYGIALLQGPDRGIRNPSRSGHQRSGIVGVSKTASWLKAQMPHKRPSEIPPGSPGVCYGNIGPWRFAHTVLHKSSGSRRKLLRSDRATG